MSLHNPNKTERLVCHNCKHKYPIDTLVSTTNADCCNKPDLHLHNVDKPCELCEKDNDQEEKYTTKTQSSTPKQGKGEEEQSNS